MNKNEPDDDFGAEFTLIRSRYNLPSDKMKDEVHICFSTTTSSENKYALAIFLGIDVASKIGLNKEKERIKIAISNKNPAIWGLVKPMGDTSASRSMSYGIRSLHKNYYMNFVWPDKKFVPKKNRDFTRRNVVYEIVDNKLYLYLDKDK